MKLFSLFSGIGAFEQALTNLGIDYELMGFSEIDKYAIASYCAIHNEPVDKNYGDISKVDEKSLPDFDMLTYGFPCTDISTAGKQLGIVEGQTRSGLLYEALRIIKAKKPKYAICENVKNLVSKKFIKDFDGMLQELNEYGYNNYWKVLNANDFGIPQSRDRVFVVSIRKDVDNGNFKFPKPGKNDLCWGDMLEKKVDQKYYMGEHRDEQLFRIMETKDDFTKGYSMKDGKPRWLLQKNDENRLIGLGNINPSGRGMSGTVFRSQGLCPTLTTSSSGYIMLEKENRVRRITPLESWRMMGFPDAAYWKARKGVANALYKGKMLGETQFLKMAGNSIAVNVLEAIFESLFRRELCAKLVMQKIENFN